SGATGGSGKPGGAAGSMARGGAGGANDMGELPGTNADAGLGQDAGQDGGQDGGEHGGLPPEEQPVPPPEAIGCITALGGGLQRIECDGIAYDLSVPERCLRTQCGLVIDVHGGTMSSRMENKNTDMQRLGAEHGYAVLQPSAPGNLWTAESDDDKVFAFANDAVSAFHLDPQRIHMMGFSQGGYMSWRFACKHSAWLASAAPAAAAGDANISPEVGCAFAAGDAPQRELPLLYMHGRLDGMVAFDNALVLRDAVREFYGTGEGEIASLGPGFTRTRYRNTRGAVFEFIEHDYSSPSTVGLPPLGVAIMGHCYPGSEDWVPSEPDQLMAFGCEAPTAFHWGEEAIRFFMAHPKR
ncbi:MAG TPA: hypothetical protein VK509_19980, partial [Polyangiales bacterium]|nr:hypothetical protein [Polyangiales bacterium]